MTTPEGYEYTIGGRAILKCIHCGSLIAYESTDKHNLFHKALFLAGLEKYMKGETGP